MGTPMGFMFMETDSAECKKRDGWLATFVLLSLLAVLCPVTAKTADKPIGEQLEKITIVYGGISAGHAPLWMTYEAGLFRKHGLPSKP